jgi:hypothetical protein
MQGSMSNVSKHNTKLKWEGNDREQSWINFLISWNSIDIDHVLRQITNIIDLEECWRDSSRVIPILLLNKVRFNLELLAILVEFIQFSFYFFNVARRNPTLGLDNISSPSESMDK